MLLSIKPKTQLTPLLTGKQKGITRPDVTDLKGQPSHHLFVSGGLKFSKKNP